MSNKNFEILLVVLLAFTLIAMFLVAYEAGKNIELLKNYKVDEGIIENYILLAYYSFCFLAVFELFVFSVLIDVMRKGVKVQRGDKNE